MVPTGEKQPARTSCRRHAAEHAAAQLAPPYSTAHASDKVRINWNKRVELLIDVACVVFIASPPGTAGKAWTQSREGGDQDLVRRSETEDEEDPTGDTD